jgi:hypothetical protein
LNRFSSVSFRRLCRRSEHCRAGDLLPEDKGRIAGSDEVEEDGPEVPLVFDAFPSPGNGERLTGTRASPDGPVIGPAANLKGKGPTADSGEEVTLGVSMKI